MSRRTLIIITLLLALTSVVSGATPPDINVLFDNETVLSCDAEGYSRTCQTDQNRTIFQAYGGSFAKDGLFYDEDPAWVVQNINGYDYQVSGTYYDFSVKANSNWGDGIRYCVYDDCLVYQASDMSYRNQDGSQDYLSNIINAPAVLGDGGVTYSGVFPNTNLTYTVDGKQVKELFVLESLPRTPNAFLSGDVTLDYGGYIKYGSLRLFIDGVERTTGAVAKTSGRVEFFDENGSLVFFLPEPIAYDSNNETIRLSYEVRDQGNQIWFYVRTPYEWLNATERAYPVYIDPTLSIDGTTSSLDGNVTAYDAIEVINGGTLTVGASDVLNITTTTFYVDATSTVDGSATVTTGSGNGGAGDNDFGSGVYQASGGGGAGHASAGGAGGYTSGLLALPAGGSTYGTSTDLTSLTVGSKGGTGGISNNDAFNDPGVGGNGGGAVRIFAYSSIIIEGTLTVAGANGGDAIAEEVPDRASAGGGGGSGGTIVLEANTITINGTIDASGGNGGACDVGVPEDVAYYGGGGSGGYFKVSYGSSITNTSVTVDLGGGSTGVRCGPDPGSSVNAVAGGAGSYYLTTGSFNQAPTIEGNATSPASPAHGDTVYLIINASDTDNDTITGVYFSLTQPNGTPVIDGVLGTRISGNASSGGTEEWHSTTYAIPSTTSSNGEWSWNATVVSDSTNPNATLSETFTITDSTSPSLSVSEPASNDVFARNISIPITYVVSDDIEVDSCWYTLDAGTTNTTIASCENTTFNVSAGNYNLTVYTNDTSGNTNSTTITNLTFTQDTTAPVVSIISPSGNTTLSILVQVQSTDAGGTTSCDYNVTRGASTEVTTTSLTFNSGTGYWEDTATMSGDATYVLTTTCTDYEGQTDSANVTWIAAAVSGGGGGATGGGGGATTVVTVPGQATLEAQPVELYLSTFNNRGELVVTNQASGTAEFTINIVSNSPELDGRIDFAGFNSATVLVDGQGSLSGNKKFVAYTIKDSETLEEGTYEAVFELRGAGGDLLDTVAVTIRVSDTIFDSLFGAFQAFIVPGVSGGTAFFLIALVVVASVLIFRTPRAKATSSRRKT